MTDGDLVATAEDLATRARALTEETHGLREDVNGLRHSYDEIDKRSKLNRLGLVLTAVLLLAVGWLALQNLELNAKQDRVIQGALCPTYDLSIGGYDPSTRPSDPASQEKYRAAIDQMIQYRNALGCQGDLVPPRIPGS